MQLSIPRRAINSETKDRSFRVLQVRTVDKNILHLCETFLTEICTNRLWVKLASDYIIVPEKLVVKGQLVIAGNDNLVLVRQSSCVQTTVWRCLQHQLSKCQESSDSLAPMAPVFPKFLSYGTNGFPTFRVQFCTNSIKLCHQVYSELVYNFLHADSASKCRQMWRKYEHRIVTGALIDGQVDTINDNYFTLMQAIN